MTPQRRAQPGAEEPRGLGENACAMGDTGVGSMLLADTATSVQRFVSVFVGVYVLLIFAYIIASWVPGGRLADARARAAVPVRRLRALPAASSAA